MSEGSKVNWKADVQPNLKTDEDIHSCQGTDFGSLLAWLSRLDKADFHKVTVEGAFDDEQYRHLISVGLIPR